MVESSDIDQLTNELTLLRIKLAATEAELVSVKGTVDNNEPPACPRYAGGQRVRITSNKIVQPAH